MFANWIPSNYEFFHVEISQYTFVNLKENIINTIYKIQHSSLKVLANHSEIIFEGKLLFLSSYVSRNITWLWSIYFLGLVIPNIWQNVLWNCLFMIYNQNTISEFISLNCIPTYHDKVASLSIWSLS